MDTKTVTLTVLVSVDIAADTNSIAEEEARRFVEGVFDGANEGFMDGWNSVEGRTEVLDIRMDIEND